MPNRTGASLVVIVILVEAPILRNFMLQASRFGMLGGDYVFVGLDPFRDEILGNSGWKTGEIKVTTCSYCGDL